MKVQHLCLHFGSLFLTLGTNLSLDIGKWTIPEHSREDWSLSASPSTEDKISCAKLAVNLYSRNSKVSWDKSPDPMRAIIFHSKAVPWNRNNPWGCSPLAVMYSVSYLTDPDMSYQAIPWTGLPPNAHTFSPTTGLPLLQPETAPHQPVCSRWNWGHWVSLFTIFPMCHIGDVLVLLTILHSISLIIVVGWVAELSLLELQELKPLL